MTDFETLWAIHPRKVGKGAAQKAFTKAIRKTTLQTMLAAQAWQVFQTQWQDERFIPHLATWLNQERWLDEKPAMPHVPPSVTKALEALDKDIQVARRRDELLRQGKSRAEVSAILEKEAEP